MLSLIESPSSSTEVLVHKPNGEQTLANAFKNGVEGNLLTTLETGVSVINAGKCKIISGNFQLLSAFVDEVPSISTVERTLQTGDIQTVEYLTVEPDLLLVNTGNLQRIF